MDRDRFMAFICYPVVVALGVMLVADGQVLGGCLQIAVGMILFGFRLTWIINRAHEWEQKR